MRFHTCLRTAEVKAGESPGTSEKECMNQDWRETPLLVYLFFLAGSWWLLGSDFFCSQTCMKLHYFGTSDVRYFSSSKFAKGCLSFIFVRKIFLLHAEIIEDDFSSNILYTTIIPFDWRQLTNSKKLSKLFPAAAKGY